jgi:hypothetical protein
MADQKSPNTASDRHEAEGEREAKPASRSGADVSNRYDESTGGDAGITNRPIDEEKANQEALPERGESKD